MTLKEAARRIREHNRIHHLAEPRNSPIITEILETAAVMFEQIDAGIYKPVIYGHWENIENAKNTIRCSNCGHIRELKHFSEIIKRPKFCEMCGAKMGESEDTDNERY